MRLDQVAQGSMPSGFENLPGSLQRAPLLHCHDEVFAISSLHLSGVNLCMCLFPLPYTAPLWKAWLYLLDDLLLGTGRLLLNPAKAFSSPG